jgi:hypothetical protein
VRRLRTQCAEDGWLGVVLGTWTRHMDCDEMLLPLDTGPSMGDRRRGIARRSRRSASMSVMAYREEDLACPLTPFAHGIHRRPDR